MTAAEIARALEARRVGPGRWMARCVSHVDKSPSLSIAEGRDGKPLVHDFGGCSQADVIAELRSRGLWAEAPKRAWTHQERLDQAQARADIKRHLPDAGYWRRAAVLFVEQELAVEKRHIFCPLESSKFDPDLVRHYTRLLSRLQVATGAHLIAEYKAWRHRSPDLTAAMIRWAKDRELAEVRTLIAYTEAND